MPFEYGVDIAHFSAVPRPDQLEGWWRQGIRFVIVGCQRDSSAHGQLQALTADDRFQLEAYQYYIWDGSEAERAARAHKIMRDFGLRRLWVDVEEARGQTPQMQVCQAIRNVVLATRSAGFEAGIYTAAWCYPEITGSATEFSDLPLWHAAYPANREPPSFDTFKPYGGWQRPAIWQYVGTTDLSGINVDLNVREVAQAPAEGPAFPDGWIKEGNYQVLYNRSVAVMRIGSDDGAFPGRIAKNFGGRWLFLRSADDGRAFWSTQEGD
jgi:hypothetical protein